MNRRQRLWTTIWILIAIVRIISACSADAAGGNAGIGPGATPSDTDNADADTNNDTDTDPVTYTDADTDGDSDSDNQPVENSSDAFTVEVHLASEENPDAPGTIGIVTWSVNNITVEQAEIHFGLDPSYGMTAPVDLSEPSYRTLLLGMKPNRTYHFQIAVHSAGNIYSSEDYTVDSGPAANLVSPVQTVQTPGASAGGFIIAEMMTPFDSGTGSLIYILDADGEVVWWYRDDIGRTSRALMSYDGKSMWLAPDTGNYDGGAIQIVSMDTLETALFEDAGISHDLTIVDENTVAYIEYGEGDCGSIFEMDREGTRAEIFESSDLFPDLEPPDCHLNSLHYYETLDAYTVSDRDHDIFFIDRQGTIEWRLTDIVSNDLWNNEQHGHQLFDNSILLFANSGGSARNTSAVFEYDLTTGAELFHYDPGEYSVWLGDVERLPNNNVLVTFSIAGVIHEIDASGNLVRTIEETTMGYTSWRPTLYGKPFHI